MKYFKYCPNTILGIKSEPGHCSRWETCAKSLNLPVLGAQISIVRDEWKESCKR